MFFWKNKKKDKNNNTDSKNQSSIDFSRNDEYFIKLALTEDEKLNIYIGWPKTDSQTIEKMMLVLLYGVLNNSFNNDILNAYKSFNHPNLNEVLKTYSQMPGNKKNYISPIDAYKT